MELLTQKEIAYKELKKGILSLRWRPGTKLVERQLSEVLGVSRTPIRESFSRLEKEGLLEHVPRWGVYVKKLDRQEVLEMYEAREALEGVAAGLASSRAVEEDLERMKQAIHKMEEALIKEGGEDRRAYDEGDNEFHNSLIKASHNKKLVELAAMCHMHVEEIPRGFKDKHAEQEEHGRLLEEHKRIMNALEDGDGVVAERLIRQHILKAKKRAEMVFQELDNDTERISDENK